MGFFTKIKSLWGKKENEEQRLPTEGEREASPPSIDETPLEKVAEESIEASDAPLLQKTPTEEKSSQLSDIKTEDEPIQSSEIEETAAIEYSDVEEESTEPSDIPPLQETATEEASQLSNTETEDDLVQYSEVEETAAIEYSDVEEESAEPSDIPPLQEASTEEEPSQLSDTETEDDLVQYSEVEETAAIKYSDVEDIEPLPETPESQESVSLEDEIPENDEEATSSLSQDELRRNLEPETQADDDSVEEHHYISEPEAELASILEDEARIQMESQEESIAQGKEDEETSTDLPPGTETLKIEATESLKKVDLDTNQTIFVEAPAPEETPEETKDESSTVEITPSEPVQEPETTLEDEGLPTHHTEEDTRVEQQIQHLFGESTASTEEPEDEEDFILELTDIVEEISEEIIDVKESSEAVEVEAIVEKTTDEEKRFEETVSDNDDIGVVQQITPDPEELPEKEQPASSFTDWQHRLLLSLRDAEPKLSIWLTILLEGVEIAGPDLWDRLAFLFTCLEAPEEEAQDFIGRFRSWVEDMEYEEVEEFRSELQYRLALALELEDEEDERNRLFLKLSEGLSKTKEQITKQLDSLLSSHSTMDDEFWDEFEEILIMADIGFDPTRLLMERLKDRARKQGVSDPALFKDLLREELAEIFKTKPTIKAVNPPEVVLMIGVNGAGKTTTIAKLAHRAQMQGKKALVAAGDTFRAAAIEQLEIWAKRVGAGFYTKGEESDPAAVAYEALDIAVRDGYDIVFVDTAGRLHTQTNLMEELKKIKRVLAKKHPGSPHRTILVLDATTGQNALSQTKLFNQAVDIDEIVLTKLDGTAKGGVIVGIVLEYGIPITFVGLGEKMEDLRPFNGQDFALALLT